MAGEAAASGGISTRTAVMALFGMMNWLYTWYNPRVDPDAEILAREISDIFLQGMRGDSDGVAEIASSAPMTQRANDKPEAFPRETTLAAQWAFIAGKEQNPAVKRCERPGKSYDNE